MPTSTFVLCPQQKLPACVVRSTLQYVPILPKPSVIEESKPPTAKLSVMVDSRSALWCAAFASKNIEVQSRDRKTKTLHTSRRHYRRADPEVIENDSNYRIKRDKNNDSVRKCRVREEQLRHELQLEFVTLMKNKAKFEYDLEIVRKEVDVVRLLVNEQIDLHGLEKGERASKEM